MFRYRELRDKFIILSAATELEQMTRYEEIEQTDFGCYGRVGMSRVHETGTIVAVRRILFPDVDEGVPYPVLKGIAAAKDLNHCNIVKLLKVLLFEKSAVLVFEYLDLDLKKFITSPTATRSPPINSLLQSFLYQILSGVSYFHSHGIIHRDLTPDNMLIDLKKKVVRIADFRISRTDGFPQETYTKELGAKQYMAPEFLMGSIYFMPVDIWAVGCIFAEMVTKKPLFSGSNEDDILFEIFRMFGVPEEANWPGVTSIDGFKSRSEKFPTEIDRSLEDEVKGLEPDGMNLLSRMLYLDPSQRITAGEALKHPYLENVAATVRTPTLGKCCSYCSIVNSPLLLLESTDLHLRTLSAAEYLFHVLHCLNRLCPLHNEINSYGMFT